MRFDLAGAVAAATAEGAVAVAVVGGEGGAALSMHHHQRCQLLRVGGHIICIFQISWHNAQIEN
jgi:hypothetical protein